MTESAGTAPAAVAATVAAAVRPASPEKLLAAVGLLGPLVGAALVGALHVLPATAGISPYSRTISEYALTGNGWAFNLGTVALAVGSLLILIALSRAGLARARSVEFSLGLLWVAALLTVVVFPKHNWAVGPSANGQIHRVASLVAFLCLPLAVLLLTRRRGAGRGLAARCGFWLGGVSLAWFTPLVGAWLLGPVTGTPWWRAVPIGLVERGLVLCEVAAVVALGVWVLTAANPAATNPAATNPAASPVGRPQTAPAA